MVKETEDLQSQIDQLENRLTRLSGRFAVLELAIIQAAKGSMPPRFHDWKQYIANMKPENFTEGKDPTLVEYRSGIEFEINRLKKLCH